MESDNRKIEEAAELAKSMIATAEAAAKTLVAQSEERAEEHHKERL